MPEPMFSLLTIVSPKLGLVDMVLLMVLHVTYIDMVLLSQYQRYQEYTFTECSLQYVGGFYADDSKKKKKML